MFPLALENYRLLSSQSLYNRSHYYANTLNSNESSKKQLTISHQPILNQSKNIFQIKKAKLRQPLSVNCVLYSHIMVNIFKFPHLVEVVRDSFLLHPLPPSHKALVLDFPSQNGPQLTTQYLILVEPALAEGYFHCQLSMEPFIQHHVYLQTIQSSELRSNDLDQFQFTTVQRFHFERLYFDFCTFFIL